MDLTSDAFIVGKVGEDNFLSSLWRGEEGRGGEGRRGEGRRRGEERGGEGRGGEGN